MHYHQVPRIFWSCSEVVGNSRSICWHSSCNCFTAFRSMLGIRGTSPSDQVGNVLAAAITAPSTKLSPLDNRPAMKFYWIQWIKMLLFNYRNVIHKLYLWREDSLTHTVMIIFMSKTRHVEDWQEGIQMNLCTSRKLNDIPRIL